MRFVKKRKEKEKKRQKYHGYEKRNEQRKNCRDIKTSLLMLKMNLMFNTAELMVITALDFCTSCRSTCQHRLLMGALRM